MSGFEGDLSASQQAALDQLRQRTRDIKSSPLTDFYLLRWLRARSFDVKKSEKMLRDSLEWRAKNNIDNILSWQPPEVLSKYYPGGHVGVDKEGYPCYIYNVGFLDIKGMFYSATKRDIVKYKMRAMEYVSEVLMPERTKEMGRKIDRFNVIVDMDNIGLDFLWKPVMDYMIEISKTMEANYPEMLRTLYIVNAPRMFPILFNLVKPFVGEDTKRKLKILGGSWKEHLMKDMDADTIPVHWGGKATDPDGDPYYKSKICMGGPIPEKYCTVNIAENIDTSSFTSVTVAKRSSLQLNFDVKKAGSLIRWNFLTQGMDIGFGVFLRTTKERQKAGDMENVVKSERVNSHMVPEYGNVTCTKPGTYVVRFDNTYSLINNKKVSYLIEILDPEMDKTISKTASALRF